MNDFLVFEIFSKEECYITLRRPGKGGAVDVCGMQVPFETLVDLVKYKEHFIDDGLVDQVAFAEAGIFSVRFE